MKSERNYELCINKKRIMQYQILDILYKPINFIWMFHMILVIVLAVMFAIGSLGISLDDIQRGVELTINTRIETQTYARLLTIFHVVSYIILSAGFLTVLKMLIYSIRSMVIKCLNNDERKKLGMSIIESLIVPAADWDSEENGSERDT